MKILSFNLLVFIVFCLSAIQIKTCNGQVLSSLIREMLGLANTYRTAGNNFHKSDVGCEHVMPIRRIPRLKSFFDWRQFAACFNETTEFGTVALKPDHGKRADQVIRDHGYNLVMYYNQTSVDGYIQTLFRITGSPVSPPRKGKQAVLIIHGAMSSIDTFLLLGEKSLPFKLADSGYEVWIPANRGTDYSQGHVKYNAHNDLEYWNFSYHEIAVYDLPMYIDLMLNETGEKKIFYIGYSLGGFALPACLSEHPMLNDKIHASFLYGAGVFTSHTTSPAKLASIIIDMPYSFQRALNRILHGNAAPPLANILSHFGSIFCSVNAVQCGLCGSLLTVFGVDASDMNYTRIPDVMSRTINSISVKYWIHLAQNYRSCKFQKFDYGPEENIKEYGQSIVPSYNLLNVRAPIYIYYGSSDYMVVPEDLRRFKDALPPGTVKGFRLSASRASNHFSFVMDKNADILFYDRIIDDMKEYSD